jgi:peroxin-3
MTTSLSSTLQAKASARFNPDAIIAEIKSMSGSNAEKLPLWNKLKTVSICRAFAGVYGGAMLSVLVRVQLNIVGGHMFIQTPSLTQEEQEEYLATVKQFVGDGGGFDEFCDELERIVGDLVSETSLKDKLNFEKVTALTYAVKNEVDGVLQQKAVDLMYSPSRTSGSDERSPNVTSAVQDTADVLENPDVFCLIRHLSQMGVNEILDAIAREWIARSNESASAQGGELEADEKPGTSAERSTPSPEANANVIPQRPLFHQFSMPFAKLLPLFAGFAAMSCMKDYARSEQLKTFSANVYESFSVPLTKM